MMKHRTVGISMSPELEKRAKARADALGLKFSPYVSLCLDAELKGFAQIVREESLDLEAAIRRAREYMERKTLSIDFEMDVENLLRESGYAYERGPRIGGLRSDFGLDLPAGPGKSRPQRAVLECRYNIRSNYALALGQALLLRANPEIGAVLLVVPYMEGFEPEIRAQFASHDIVVTTPDRLQESLQHIGVATVR